MPKFKIQWTETIHRHHEAVIEADSESAARQAFVDGIDSVYDDNTNDESEPFYDLVPDDTPLVPADSEVGRPMPAEAGLYITSVDYDAGTDTITVVVETPNAMDAFVKLATVVISFPSSDFFVADQNFSRVETVFEPDAVYAVASFLNSTSLGARVVLKLEELTTADTDVAFVFDVTEPIKL